MRDLKAYFMFTHKGTFEDEILCLNSYKIIETEYLFLLLISNFSLFDSSWMSKLYRLNATCSLLQQKNNQLSFKLTNQINLLKF